MEEQITNKVIIKYRGNEYTITKNIFNYILRAAEQDLASGECDTYNDKQSLKTIFELQELVV